MRFPRVQTPFKRHSDTCAITRNMYPAFLAGVPDAPGQIRWRPQTPRGVGNDEAGCLKVSEGSEMMKQVV